MTIRLPDIDRNVQDKVTGTDNIERLLIIIGLTTVPDRNLVQKAMEDSKHPSGLWGDFGRLACRNKTIEFLIL